jgi:hypothetical protein
LLSPDISPLTHVAVMDWCLPYPDIRPKIRQQRDFLGQAHATGDVGPVAGWLSQLLALGKSGSRGGRPRIDSDLRALIKKMNLENPLWGAPQ